MACEPLPLMKHPWDPSELTAAAGAGERAGAQAGAQAGEAAVTNEIGAPNPN